MHCGCCNLYNIFEARGCSLRHTKNWKTEDHWDSLCNTAYFNKFPGWTSLKAVVAITNSISMTATFLGEACEWMLTIDSIHWICLFQFPPQNYRNHINFITALSFNGEQNVIHSLWHNFKHNYVKIYTVKNICSKALTPNCRCYQKVSLCCVRASGGNCSFSQGDGFTLCSLYQHLMCWNPRVFLRKIIVFSSQLAAPGLPKINRGLLCDPFTQKQVRKKSSFVPYFLFLMADSSYYPMTQISFPSFTSSFTLTSSSCLSHFSLVFPVFSAFA